MTTRQWAHNLGTSALVIVIAAVGMVATAQIWEPHGQSPAGGQPPAAAGQPTAPTAAASSPGHQRGQRQPSVASSQEPTPGTQLDDQPSPQPDVRPEPQSTPPAPAHTSAPQPRPRGSTPPPPSPTTSTGPAPTPTPPQAEKTGCVINVLGIQVCIGGSSNG